MVSISSSIKSLMRKGKFCSAVILAAGSGTRFSPDVKKQFVEINHKSILLTTALAFEKSTIIDEIIVVTNADEVKRTYNNLKKNNISKLTKVIAGGSTRLESSRKGVEAISPDCDFVAIHDAARCLITDTIIKNVFENAFIYKAATAASKITDTVKRTNNMSFVKETVSRDNLWSVQTPQVFNANLIRAAHYYAEKDGFFGTDDCSICEHIGHKIKIVDTGNLNIKITYPEDIIIAEAILKNRENTEV